MPNADVERKQRDLIEQALSDKAMKKRLFEDASGLFAEHGLPVPDGVELKVVDENGRTRILPLPGRPVGGELSDEDMRLVSGGNFTKVEYDYKPRL